MLNELVCTMGYGLHGSVETQKSIRFKKLADATETWHGEFVIDDGLTVSLNLVPTAS